MAGLDRERICLYCWIHCERMVLECESHMFMECPMNECSRVRLMSKMSETTKTTASQGTDARDSFQRLLANAGRDDWKEIGLFLHQ
eukprot:8273524-Karenia_brevis.AAC.1